jgi:hypothetical protein
VVIERHRTPNAHRLLVSADCPHASGNALYRCDLTLANGACGDRDLHRAAVAARAAVMPRPSSAARGWA